MTTILCHETPSLSCASISAMTFARSAACLIFISVTFSKSLQGEQLLRDSFHVTLCLFVTLHTRQGCSIQTCYQAYGPKFMPGLSLLIILSGKTCRWMMKVIGTLPVTAANGRRHARRPVEAGGTSACPGREQQPWQLHPCTGGRRWRWHEAAGAAEATVVGARARGWVLPQVTVHRPLTWRSSHGELRRVRSVCRPTWTCRTRCTIQCLQQGSGCRQGVWSALSVQDSKAEP